MKIRKQEQETIDIDWFCVDQKGKIIHFASGGGELPKCVSKDKFATFRLAEFFRLFAIKTSNVKLNDKLSNFVGTEMNVQQLERYSADFIGMAKKGIYSFDKSNPGNFENKKYHLVAFPNEKYLTIDDLPQEIKATLSENILDVDIEHCIEVTIEMFG